MLSIVGIVGVPARYGGFETLVDNLLEVGFRSNVVVYCSARHYSNKLSEYKGAKLRYIPLAANGVQSIVYDIVSLVDAVTRGSNTILLLGVSGAIILPFVRLFSSVRIVTNVDGIEWRREKWGGIARCYLRFSERLAVRFSNHIISDNECIQKYLSDEYAVDSTVIAYGGDHGLSGSLSIDSDGYALSLCRIEPENNCHIILEAFCRSGQKLKFVGNWGASDYGLGLKDKYQNCKNIEILDSIYDSQKLFHLRDRCLFYVHGHSAGGTNPSLVEMMFFGKCILCFDCDYNRSTTEGGALYFRSASDLVAMMGDAIDNCEVGKSMLQQAYKKYTWRKIGQEYNSLIYDD